ncbi:MAG: hypothetical protein AAFQ84_00665 [Pseudomonadota bacterium]
MAQLNGSSPAKLASLPEAISLLGLSAAALVLGPVFASSSDAGHSFNMLLAGLLTAILVYFAVRDVAARRERLWTSLFWFRISSAVYCGFGTIVPYIVNARTESYIRSVFDFTEADVLKVLQIFILSITIVICTVALINEPTPSKARQPLSKRRQNNTILLAAALFLIFGGAIRYGIHLPRMYGLSDIYLPATILTLGKAYVAGLFLLMFHGLRTKSLTLALALGLFVVDFSAGLLAFDKSEMLTSLIFIYLAYIFHNFRLNRALIGTVLAFTVLIVTQPLVHFGRAEVQDLNGGRGNTATISERIEIVERYWENQNTAQFGNVQEKDPLLRLSFVNVAAFVVDQYDQGRPGERFRYVFASIVPRALWPNKPAVGELGSETFYLIRGRDGASVGTTHFAEAYWAYGWIGLPLVFIPGGIILALTSRYTIASVRNDRWLRLPAILLAVIMGHRVSGSFVSDMIGGGVIFLALALAIRLAELYLDGSVAEHARRRGLRRATQTQKRPIPRSIATPGD